MKLSRRTLFGTLVAAPQAIKSGVEEIAKNMGMEKVMGVASQMNPGETLSTMKLKIAPETMERELKNQKMRLQDAYRIASGDIRPEDMRRFWNNRANGASIHRDELKSVSPRAREYMRLCDYEKNYKESMIRQAKKVIAHGVLGSNVPYWLNSMITIDDFSDGPQEVGY